MDLDHLSHTRVATYLSCGEKYRLKYVEEFPRSPQGAFIGGVAVHETIEEASNTGLWANPEAFQEPSGDIVVFFREHLLAAVQEAGGAEAVRWGGRKTKTFPQGEDLQWWFTFGPGMLNRYHTLKLQDVEDGWEVFGSEIEATFNLGSGMRVVARMDEVLSHADGTIKVRDYKTGQPRPEEVIQLGLYAHACKVTLGFTVTFGELAYLKKTSNYLSTFAAQPWIDSVMTWLDRAEGGLSKEVYLLRPSSFCSSCDVKAGCQYGRQLIEGDEVAQQGGNDG